MSNLKLIEQSLELARPEFNKLAASHKEVQFEHECRHALSILKGNEFSASIAQKNPESLMSAIYQCAMVGLSLNPAKKQSYLVPYGGKNPRITFHPGYIGLVHLGIQGGGIEWVQAYDVRENDKFEFLGAGVKPLHSFDPFTERGELRGVYCVAKTPGGDYLVDMMGKTEVYKIRERSESYKAGYSSPWKTDEVEMFKKTVIRRAQKLWPNSSERMSKAVEILNSVDGVNEIAYQEPAEDLLKELKRIVGLIPGNTGGMLVNHVNSKFKTNYENLDELGQNEINYSIEFLAPYAKGGQSA